MIGDADLLRDTAERGWAWTLDQVHWDADGPWLPESVPLDGSPLVADDSVRDTFYDGIAGLAPALLEIRAWRPWNARETELADAIVVRLSARARLATECSLYLGVAGDVTALALLAPDSVSVALDRLAALATPEGWPTAFSEYGPVVHDVVLGTAGGTMAALFCGTTRGEALARTGCGALLAVAEQQPDGLDWAMAANRLEVRMPNYAHGTGGIATALAVAGAQLEEPEFIAAAVAGAEHLIGLADFSDGHCRIPVRIPDAADRDRYAYGWCHGIAGTSLLWAALTMAGVEEVRGWPVAQLRARSLQAACDSGLPARRYPGFWDNDGRCCGTSGVGEAMLDGALCDVGGRGERWLDFGLRLAHVLVERALPAAGEDEQRFWRFTEHRREPSLLDPAPGWMQGAAGISTFLWRAARAAEAGRPVGRVGLPDNWWAIPEEKSSNATHRSAGT